MKKELLIVGLAGALAAHLSGCGPAELDDETGQTEDGLITPIAGRVSFWSNGVVNMCIVPKAGQPQTDFAAAKEQVIIALENGWQRHGNLRFDFRCLSGAKATLTLNPVFDLNGGGGAGLGASANTTGNIDYCSPSLPGANCKTAVRNGVTRRIDSNEQFRATVLHEVGHMLGFVHEHKRTDTPADASWCKATWVTEREPQPGDSPMEGARKTVDNGFEPDGGRTWSTAYDHDSIMNYCRDVDRNQQGDEPWDHVSDRLSEGDKKGMSMVYGPPVPLGGTVHTADGLYRPTNSSAVFLLRSGSVCHVTWAQFVDVGQPMVTVVSSGEGSDVSLRANGKLCTKAAMGALPDDFYRQYNQPGVYRLKGERNCGVTWDQFVRLGQPMQQLLTAADGQRMRDAYGSTAVCTNAELGL